MVTILYFIRHFAFYNVADVKKIKLEQKKDNFESSWLYEDDETMDKEEAKALANKVVDKVLRY